jgi:hypothetical protein
MAICGAVAAVGGVLYAAGPASLPAPASGPATATAPATVKVMGIETPGKRIVFIVDHSGSMLDTFDYLRAFMLTAIDSLAEDREGGVLLVAGTVEAVGEKKIVPMTAEAKKKIAEGLAKARVQGASDDDLSSFAEAFKKAFVMKPDTIFFLTDGHFDPRLQQQVKLLNAKKGVAVNTVTFIIHEPSNEEALKEMAKANGGQFRFVSEKEVQGSGK